VLPTKSEIDAKVTNLNNIISKIRSYSREISGIYIEELNTVVDELDDVKLKNHLKQTIKILTPDITPEQLKGIRRVINDYIHRDKDLPEKWRTGPVNVVDYFKPKSEEVPEPEITKADVYGQTVWSMVANSNPNENDPGPEG